MKRFLGFIAFILVIYVIYFDLTTGTLPITIEATTTEKTESSHEPVEKNKEAASIDYFEIKVKSGDTVLSIIEGHLNASLPVPIEQVITDFKSLNNGLDPKKIQLGKTYKFPNYLVLVE